MTTTTTARPRAPSRRSVFALIGGAAAVPTAAAAVPIDDPIIALYDELHQLEELKCDATEVADLTEFAARKFYPRRPLALYYRRRRLRDDGTMGVVLEKRSRNDIIRDRDLRLISGLGDVRAIHRGYDALLKAADEYDAACRVVNAAHDVPRLRREEIEATTRWAEALQRFVATEPRTIRGVILKVREAKAWNDVGTGDTLDQLINGLAALDPRTIRA